MLWSNCASCGKYKENCHNNETGEAWAVLYFISKYVWVCFLTMLFKRSTMKINWQAKQFKKSLTILNNKAKKSLDFQRWATYSHWMGGKIRNMKKNYCFPSQLKNMLFFSHYNFLNDAIAKNPSIGRQVTVAAKLILSNYLELLKLLKVQNISWLDPSLLPNAR